MLKKDPVKRRRRSRDSRKISIAINDVDPCSIQNNTIASVCLVDRDMRVPPVHEDSLVVDRNV